jgi:hypothetical protein
MDDPTTYQIWKHREAPEWWAVRIEYGALTGAAGPYPAGGALGELGDLLYEDHPDDLEWFIRAQEDFDIVHTTQPLPK